LNSPSLEIRCEVVRVGSCHEGFLQELDLSPIQRHECQCDDDCYGRQKCCQEMTGRRCADPLPAKGKLRLSITYALLIAAACTNMHCLLALIYNICIYNICIYNICIYNIRIYNICMYM
jgi:hypothetical protein